MTEENSPKRIDEILIQVSDVQRSMKFYRDGLGLPLKATGHGDDSFEGKVGGVRFLIHPDFDRSLENERRGLGIHFHFWVPDADMYYDRLRKQGVRVIEPPEDRPWGRHMAVVDPDGYRIEILGPVKRPSLARSKQKSQ